VNVKTQYNGVNFRSRLEAKWAAFFDLAGWRWEYEPAGEYGYWIPDFVVWGRDESPIPTEVKPIEWEGDGKAWRRQVVEYPGLAKARQWKHEVLILGARPIGPCSCGLGHALGMIGRGNFFEPCCDLTWRVTPPYQFGLSARRISSEPCRFPDRYDEPDGEEMELTWREAGNRTQWRA
jgi:hypothetical protein